MRYSILLLLSAWIFLAGCDVTVASESATVTPDFVTATLPPSPISLPTQTLPPSTPAPTIPPIEGMTTTQINVRAETSTASENLGTISQFSKVQIIGRDSSTSWYQIIYSGSPTGTGWVRAEYVQVTAAAEIPVIASGTGGGSAVSGLVIKKINVRNGPGTSFEALGELNPNDVVFISGKDESGEWAQIEFANSAEGKGWAALKFLQVENPNALPVIGAVAETPAMVETSQANTLLRAWQDGDSKESPWASINFSALGARSAWIDGDVSSPDGDTEDWIGLKSYNGKIAIQLLCMGNALQMEIWKNGQVVDSFALSCMEERVLNLPANTGLILRLSEPNSGGFLYTIYELILEAIQ